jgi:hypothetical protein
MGLTKSFQCLSQRCGLFFGLGFVLQGSLLKEAPDRFLVNEVLKLEPISGHHFNLKAPNQCGKFSFIEKTVSKLTCQLSEPGKQSIVVNICDDNESFCKPERFTVQVSAPKGWKKTLQLSVVLRVIYLHLKTFSNRHQPVFLVMLQSKPYRRRARTTD